MKLFGTNMISNLRTTNQKGLLSIWRVTRVISFRFTQPLVNSLHDLTRTRAYIFQATKTQLIITGRNCNFYNREYFLRSFDASLS